MSILFSSAEIVNMSIAIEKNGMAFYNAMANMVEDDQSKGLYTYRAGEEVRHKILFQKMLDNLSQPELTVSDEEEYKNYLGALTSSRVFKSDVNTEELIAEAKDHMGALNMAIEFEKDSILFYYELMDQVIEDDKEGVEMVLKEEKAHLAQLITLRAKLST